MLNIYLQQLLEAKKQVYDAMKIGDFDSVQRLMEIYKNMEQKLQLPIYRRISRMTSVEIKQLSEILVSKGINLDLNDNNLKNKIISMFIDEKLITTFKENYVESHLMGLKVYEPKEGSAKVSIFHTSSEKFEKDLTVSERVFKKIGLGAYSNFNLGIDYGVMNAIDENASQWSRFEYTSYSIDDIDKIIGTMGSLRNLSGDFIDKASLEYHTLLKMCRNNAKTEQLQVPFIINNMDELKQCILEQFCKSHGIQDGYIENSMKESELIVKIWEDMPLYPNEEEAKRYGELVSELSSDIIKYTEDNYIDLSYKGLKKLQKEIIAKPIADSNIASKLMSYISNMIGFHNQKIKKFLEDVKQNEGINTIQFADANTYYNNPEQLDELLNKHVDKIKDIKELFALLKCDSLDMLKQKVKSCQFYGNEEITQYLSRIIPREEVIQQFCKTLFIELDDVFVKNGFNSILKNEIIKSYDNSKGIDWFELLAKDRDKFNELIRFINDDWREIETLRNTIHAAKEFSWYIYNQEKKSENEYSEQLKIDSFPTLDSSFEFESDIESLSEYLSEKNGKSK